MKKQNSAKVPTVYGNSKDQSIRMYWGNEDALPESNGEDVFKSTNGFKGVWHLNEDGNTSNRGYKDSTGYLHHGTGINTDSNSDVDGMIARAQNLYGTNSYIQGVDSQELKITGNMTISFWMKTNQTASDWVRLLGKGNTTHRNYGLWLNRTNNKILFQQYNNGSSILDVTSTNATSNNSWYYVAATVNGNSGSIYINGDISGTATRTGIPSTDTNPLTIGYAGFHTYYNGEIDEVVISNTARSASWIKLCYENQKNGQTLVNVEKKPFIKSAEVSTDNTYINVKFNEGLYTNQNGTGALNINDFAVDFEQNGGNQINVSIVDITRVDGNPLSGGEDNIKLLLAASGSVVGLEKIILRPYNSSTIFNKTGSSMEQIGNNIELSLNRNVSSTEIIDNTDNGFTSNGSWSSSISVAGFYGVDYLHDGTAGSDGADNGQSGHQIYLKMDNMMFI